MTIQQSAAPHLEISPTAPAVTNSEQSPKPKWKPRHRLGWRGVVVLIFIVILVCLVGFGIGLYRLNWQGQWVDAVVRTLPYPVIRIASAFVPYEQFLSDRNTLRHYFSQAGVTGAPTGRSLDASVLTKLARDRWISDAAATRGVTVAPDDITKEYNNIVQQSGGVTEVERMIRTLYDWSVEDFQANVVTPYVLRLKLEAQLRADPTLDANLRNRADAVLVRAKAGEDFSALAREFSEDSSASSGGDLGAFGAGAMVPEFQAAVESLEPGEVSDLVKTAFGYHIVKLEEQTMKGEEKQWRARHILFRVIDVDQWMSEQMALTTVFVFPSGFHWDGSCVSVLVNGENCPSAS